MRNITLFIGSLSSGGAERQLVELANMLSLKDCNVTIVTFADEPDHYICNSMINRIRLAPNRSKFIKLNAIFSFFINIQTDCIISFTQRANLLALIPMMFRSKAIKFIAGERNYSVSGATFIEKLLFNFFYKRATWIVTNSFSQAKYIMNKKPQYTNKIHTITNYTNLDLYKGDKYEFMNNRFAVFARYDPQKNFKRFALAVKHLKDELGESFRIDWYGNITFKNKVNPHYEMFMKLINLYEIHNVMKLHSHINDVSHAMLVYDAVVLPSVFEGFSNAIGEAICTGRPMIVSDVSDNSIMVHDGINGFLFNPYSAEDIAQALKKFILLPFEKRVSMSHHSRAIAESLFNRSKFVDNYLFLIDN